MDDPNDTAYARAPEPEDLVRICRALNAAGARYILIGGFAVIAHGGSRFTKDVDLLVDDAPDNLGGVSVPIASPATLVRTKDTYRPQDAIDRSFLRELLARRQRT